MTKKVGIIVGRFQVAELHPGHQHLLMTAHKETDHVIIFLGSADQYFTKKNPLPYYHRKNMLIEYLPEAQIIPLNDIPGSDQLWTHKLDEEIGKYIRSNEEPILYGSRDSFITIYEDNDGKYSTRFVNELEGYSGTKDREQVTNVFYNSPDYRKGIIYTVLNSKHV